jgi:endonuclease III related protein
MHHQLRKAYKLMLGYFDHQKWWPGDSPFEICVGAILTQNTNWQNVERAIENLREHQSLDLQVMNSIENDQLASLIRPAGYYNLKARRLKSFTKFIVDEYGGRLDRLFESDTHTVREQLLEVKGIGPETADSILLYAGDHPSFVIDAYTKRIFSRHSWVSQNADYDEMKQLCEQNLSEKTGPARLDYWQDYHAQLVMIGKDFCRPNNPRCDTCPLQPLLPSDR